MNNKCVVNFASTGRELYLKAQLRLIKSFIEKGWDGDFLLRSTDGYCDNYMGVEIKLGSLPITEKYGKSYNHEEIQYGFKLFLIWEAYEKGYRKILWCDSTIVCENNLEPLWDYAAKHGVCSFDNLGFPLKHWMSDVAFNNLSLTKSEIENMKQIMACAVFFDFDHPKTMEVFEKWMERCLDGGSFNTSYGSIREGFRGHRGDQPCLSAILQKNNIPILPYGGLCYPPHNKTQEFGKPYLVNTGIM